MGQTEATKYHRSDWISYLIQGQYIILALLMIGITIVGFWENYFGPLMYGTLDAHWAIHLHAAIFTIWLLIFLGQAIFAYLKKIDTHQSTGTYIGISWGVLLLIIGLFITFAVILPGIGRDHHVDSYAYPSLLGSLGDIITFGIFFVFAVKYRRTPDIHKRLMVLATVALLGAPVARLDLIGGELVGLAYFVILRLLPLFVAMGYDRWIRSKIHWVYWVGLAVIALNISRIFWGRSEIWHKIGTWMTKTMKPFMESVL